MIALAILLQTLRPITFGDFPIKHELLVGEALERDKKGIERTMLQDRVAIGRWFDGTRRVDDEEAIWLSPAMVSRWLGWRQSREGWPDEELNRRWCLAKARLDGKMTFIVRLSSFPKIDLWEGPDAPAKHTEDLEDARGVITFGGEKNSARKHEQGRNALLAMVNDQNPQPVLSTEWESLPPMNDVLEGTYCTNGITTINPNLDFGYGGYTGAFWIEQFKLPKDLFGNAGFDLQVVTAHKKRVAHFALVETKPPKRKVLPTRWFREVLGLR